MTKISALPEVTSADNNDYLVVDVNPITPTSTSKIQKSNLLSDYATTASVTSAITAAATPPATFTANGTVKQTVYNVRDYGALGDGVTDDIVALTNAANAVTAGGVLLFPPGNFVYSSPLNLKPGTHLLGSGMGATTMTSTFSSNGRGGLELGINNVANNITIEQVTFSTAASCHALVLNGVKNVIVRECNFTGTTNNSLGTVLVQDSGSLDTSDIIFQSCRFSDLINTPGIFITSANNGRTVRDITVTDCHFENVFTYAVHVDVSNSSTGYMRSIRVTNNTFVDLIGGTGNNQVGLAVFAGLGSTYQVFDVLVDGNTYRNSRSGNEQLGFAWLYNMTTARVTNNTAVGPSTYMAGQIFMAPGRVTTPIIGLEVGNNYVEGFVAFMDPDSMMFVEIHNNTIRNCQGNGGGGQLGTGYGIQAYLDVHDNVSYNSWSTVSGLESFVLMANSSALSSKVHDNIFIEDTVARHTKYAIQATTGFNFSDVEIYNNKFYMPSNDLEAFLSKQSGATYPRRIENNTVVQASGVFNYNQITGSPYGETILKSGLYNGVNLSTSSLATPVISSVTSTGATGSTAYNYKVVAVNADGSDGITSAASTTLSSGNATLTNSNYNTVTWALVDGARAYKVLRSVNGGTYLLLTLATNSVADATTSGVTILDQGQYATSTYSPVTTNPGGLFTANKINITTGSNAAVGTSTLAAGTATISTTAVTASSLIFLTDTSGSTGQLSVGTKTAGTSFVVNSSLITDTSTFNWWVVN